MPVPVKITIPSVSLFGLPFKEKCKLLQEARFDGIELFVFPRNAKKLPHLRKIARDHGLHLSLHQGWSLGDNDTHLSNRLLDFSGYLWKDPYRLSNQTSLANGESFVAYPDRIDEIRRWERDLIRCRVEIWFQTESCRIPNTGIKSAPYRMKYDRFRLDPEIRSFPIVFDTFHVLEWKIGCGSPVSLQYHAKERLAIELIDALDELGGLGRVREIHWNDFAPAKGHSAARAVLPGDGILSLGLKRLARRIIRENWNGFVSPEVPPQTLFPYTASRLRMVRERVFRFFG